MTIDPLNEACDILDEFEKDVAKVQANWKEIAELNPDFEQVSPERWQEKCVHELGDSTTVRVLQADSIFSQMEMCLLCTQMKALCPP